MLKTIIASHYKSAVKLVGSKSYSFCCPPPQQPPCGCPPPSKCPSSGSGKKRIVPPTTCRPGPVPPNPCVPIFHQGKNTWKKYKYFSLFFCFPVIILLTFNALSHEPAHKGDCRDYEYMRIRSKRFPWGDGTKSLFHNDHVNHLPGECVVPESECD